MSPAGSRHNAAARARRTPAFPVALALVLVLCLVLAAAACSDEEPAVTGPRQPANPAPIVWGIAENLHRDPTTIDQKVALMKRLGVRMVRMDLGTTPTDVRAVRTARRAGLRVLGVVLGPREPEAYAEWISELVTLYAPLGVHHYEIWNEPNIPHTWPTADDPARAVPEYMALVRAAYPRVKRIDPRSVVLVGALSRRETVGGRPNDWLAAMYDNGLEGNFDAISVHPYTDPELPGEDTPAAYAWREMAGPWTDRNPSMRDEMIAHGDGDKRIWITEYSAPTGGGLGTPVDEERQAQIARRAVTLAQSYPWLGGFFWYGLRDQPSGSEAFGLLRADWTVKPAYRAYAGQIRATRGRPAGSTAP
ncbi:MAG: hypothetical protein AB7V42_05780 [Thermoleophilia bacterium]